MTDRELMQQALDALEDFNESEYGWDAKQKKAYTALRARLAQCDAGEICLGCRVCPDAQPEPEPVAWLYKKKDGMQVITDDPDYADGTWTPLFTTPPQREFIGLTDEEIQKMHHQIKTEGMGAYKTEDIYRAIEAKLKEKNSD